ncbi:MAG: hypothetical protein LBC18_03140 [Opitutaceae bacterium]|jgi:hypothetical protein|nr:hypothetical protein [Opitutaceae bacterium]
MKKTDKTNNETAPESAAKPLLPSVRGKLSPSLEAALKAAGKKVTEKMVAEQEHTVELRRQLWVADAIRLGVILLAKKADLGHGKFRKWLIGYGKQNSNVARGRHLTARSKPEPKWQQLSKYLYLARRYLAALDAGPRIDARHTMGDLVRAPESAGLVKSVAELPLALLGGKGTAQHMQALHDFVAGRSLRQLLTDLHEAEKDEVEDEIRHRRTVNADTGEVEDEEEDVTAAAPPMSAKQLEIDFSKKWVSEIIPTIEKNWKEVAAQSARLPSDYLARYWRDVRLDLEAKAKVAKENERAATSAARMDVAKHGAAQTEAVDALAPDVGDDDGTDAGGVMPRLPDDYFETEEL